MTHPILQGRNLVTNFVVTYGYNLLKKKITTVGSQFGAQAQNVWSLGPMSPIQ